MRTYPFFLLLLPALMCGAQVAPVAPVSDKQHPVGDQNEQRFAQALRAPGVIASVNKVLMVTAPPYNAKCDGVTDDQQSIQQAFDDAFAKGYSVEFPVGTCRTGTIFIKGQPFFGHGKTLTTIVGLPGQDVFATTDPTPEGLGKTKPHIHDLTIQVDSSVDAAATAAGGNNTFPNRISGTAGGLVPLDDPPAPGPLVFGPATHGNCAGAIAPEARNQLQLPCASFTHIPDSRLRGAPIAIYGLPGGAAFKTTIVRAIDDKHLELAAAAPRAGTNLAGSYLKPLTPPWYFGNCGIAFPGTDADRKKNRRNMVNGWVFENLQIQSVNEVGRQANHTCGIFLQADHYALNFQHIEVTGLWGGIVEAMPVENVGDTTYAPDTLLYSDVNFQWDLLPLITYNGFHRLLSGVSIYGGAWVAPQGTGVWMLQAKSGFVNGLAAGLANAVFTNLYYECPANTSGEVERFMGLQTDIYGGAPTQCASRSQGPWMMPAYVNWMASDGTVIAQIGDNLKVTGDHNTFKNTALTLGSVTDRGSGNTIESGFNQGDPLQKRQFYANYPLPQEPVGKLDGGFVMSGNSGTPFVSSSDLVTTCRDYRLLTPVCVNDAGGQETTGVYLHETGPALDKGFGTGQVAVWQPLMAMGPRIPLTKVYVATQGRCVGSQTCSSTIEFRDRTSGNALVGRCGLSFGPNWTVTGGPTAAAPCVLDLTHVPYGDVLGWDVARWTGGATAVDISFLAFEPQNADVLAQVRSALALSGTTGGVGGEVRPGACASGLAQVEGAVPGMAVVATPKQYPGDAFEWRGYVSAPGVVTVKVCNRGPAPGVASASTYAVRVLQ